MQKISKQSEEKLRKIMELRKNFQTVSNSCKDKLAVTHIEKIQITIKVESNRLDVLHFSKMEFSFRIKNRSNKLSRFHRVHSKTHSYSINLKVHHFPIKKSKSIAIEITIKETEVSLIKVCISMEMVLYNIRTVIHSPNMNINKIHQKII
jgi:hypothetical protein